LFLLQNNITTKKYFAKSEDIPNAWRGPKRDVRSTYQGGQGQGASPM